MLGRIIAILGIITCLAFAYFYATMSDIARLNKVLFNRLAPEYDDRYNHTISFLVEQVQKESREFIDFKRGGRLLDYACGTGLLSDALEHEVSQAIGIDVSTNMITYYNAKAESRRLNPDQRSGYLGNLLALGDTRPAAFSGPKFFHFDLVGVALGFHHFADPLMAAQRLVERLSYGGVLFIIDLLPHHPDQPMAGVPHNGFSKEQMHKLFKDAGAGTDFRWKILDQEIVLKGGQSHSHSHQAMGGHGHAHGHAHEHDHGGHPGHGGHAGHGAHGAHGGHRAHNGYGHEYAGANAPVKPHVEQKPRETVYKVFFARGVKA